jgi:hypothetical protein
MSALYQEQRKIGNSPSGLVFVLNSIWIRYLFALKGCYVEERNDVHHKEEHCPFGQVFARTHPKLERSDELSDVFWAD